jgi:hypothetical protein
MTAAIKASAKAYEAWLADALGGDLVAADLTEKHDKMRDGPFPFLRATYWRWAETILDTCPDLASAPPVLAIGDTHVENFGCWRDAEGRLVWGANDFDDAAVMPYPLDLVRLAASALLARGDEDAGAREICEAILEGYAAGLAEPRPFILERDHRWLREAVVLPEPERAAFWAKFAAPKTRSISARYHHALRPPCRRSRRGLRDLPAHGRGRQPGPATVRGPGSSGGRAGAARGQGGGRLGLGAAPRRRSGDPRGRRRRGPVSRRRSALPRRRRPGGPPPVAQQPQDRSQGRGATTCCRATC